MNYAYVSLEIVEILDFQIYNYQLQFLDAEYKLFDNVVGPYTNTCAVFNQLFIFQIPSKFYPTMSYLIPKYLCLVSPIVNMIENVTQYFIVIKRSIIII